VSFFEIFLPGLKYLREEKDRQKMLVSKPTHGGGAPLGIDLDGGTARISIPRPPAASEDQTLDPQASQSIPVRPALDDEPAPPDSS
jgi:hypothetical protein